MVYILTDAIKALLELVAVSFGSCRRGRLTKDMIESKLGVPLTGGVEK